MGDKYVFKGLTFITFSMFLFSSCFGLETTLYHLKTDDNLPIHRLYLFLTLIIFLFNVSACI